MSRTNSGGTLLRLTYSRAEPDEIDHRTTPPPHRTAAPPPCNLIPSDVQTRRKTSSRLRMRPRPRFLVGAGMTSTPQRYHRQGLGWR